MLIATVEDVLKAVRDGGGNSLSEVFGYVSLDALTEAKCRLRDLGLIEAESGARPHVFGLTLRGHEYIAAAERGWE